MISDENIVRSDIFINNIGSFLVREIVIGEEFEGNLGFPHYYEVNIWFGVITRWSLI